MSFPISTAAFSASQVTMILMAVLHNDYSGNDCKSTLLLAFVTHTVAIGYLAVDANL